MPSPNGHHNIKRIQLPSGKTIEVVFFEAAAGSPRSEQHPAPVEASTIAPARQLHVCPACDSNLVYPTEWAEAGRRSWTVSLRCPACEWSHTGDFSQEIVDLFDEELDLGTEALMTDLEHLTRANMAEETERFIAALQTGGIEPMDF